MEKVTIKDCVVYFMSWALIVLARVLLVVYGVVNVWCVVPWSIITKIFMTVIVVAGTDILGGLLSQIGVKYCLLDNPMWAEAWEKVPEGGRFISK